MNAPTIEPAAEADLPEVRDLFLEYAREWPGPEFELQHFDQELATLPGPYAAPRGCILLARRGTALVGVIALRPLDDTTCEAKRLFVRPAWRGFGAGKRLVAALIGEARARGYSRIVLDTTPSMRAAIAVYAALGFTPAPRYHEATAEDAVFMERRL